MRNAGPGASYQKLQDLFSNALEYLEQAENSFAPLRPADSVADEVRLAERRKMKQRSESDLLTIAFFGAFSSGKSFLISGLCGRVQFIVTKGYSCFIPLLPASPKHTSSCPLVVEPDTTGGGKDRFYVRFLGSEAWTEIVSPRQSTIRAYATDLSNAIADREPNDRQRKTIAARLAIPSPLLQARLCDLPGYGAVDVDYNADIRAQVLSADCLVYVSAATKPLGNEDLEQLRFIYNHHKDTGKPAFFVLTCIDLYDELDFDSSEPKWKVVQEENNRFLTKHFLLAEQVPDLAFIGHGFIPVSAALEAREVAEGAPPVPGLRHGMDLLRSEFQEYLETSSGPGHLADLASEMNIQLIKLEEMVSSAYRSERLPVERVTEELALAQGLLDNLNGQQSRLASRLQSIADQNAASCLSSFRSRDLAKRILDEVGPFIDTSDIVNPDVHHKLECQIQDIVRVWAASEKGLLESILGSLKRLSERCKSELSRGLKDAGYQGAEMGAEPSQQPAPEPSEFPAIKTLETRIRSDGISDIISMVDVAGRILGTAGGISFVAGVGSLVPFAAVLPPAGIILFVAASFVAVTQRVKHKALVKEQRQHYVDVVIPEYATRLIADYREETDKLFKLAATNTMLAWDQAVNNTEQRISSLERRIKDADFQKTQARLKVLEDVLVKCAKAGAGIEQIHMIVELARAS